MAPKFIWQHPNWPTLTFDAALAGPALVDARRLQVKAHDQFKAVGLDLTGTMAQEELAQEVLSTAAIEGEKLDPAAVRSSILRKLRLGDIGPHDRHVDGLVDVLSDATTGFDAPLDEDRLCRWQAALFPGGTSGLRRIAVGQYRAHADPVQIVSGLIGREVVHYEAPPSGQVPIEMRRFLAWFNGTAPTATNKTAPTSTIDGIARAALAHLWFESIHPFEDGNGRIGRAIVDMALAQDRGVPTRLVSLSRQLMQDRSAYYDALNAAQRGNGDTSAWVQWFATAFGKACTQSLEVAGQALKKARFWAIHSATHINPRQRKVLQRLLDAGDGGFLGGMSADKYAKTTGASKATATRDLAGLLAAGLVWTTGQGRATRYYINVPGWTHEQERGLDKP
jgi:Fic family protein